MVRSANHVAADRLGRIVQAIEEGDESSALLRPLSKEQGVLEEQYVAALVAPFDGPTPPWSPGFLLSSAVELAIDIQISPELQVRIARISRTSLESPDPVERAAAAEGLGLFGSDSDADCLDDLASRDPDSLVRVNALDALAMVDPDRARAAIPRRLREETDLWVRANIQAHEFISGLSDTVPPLGELLDQGFAVVGNFIRTVGDLLSDRLPESKRALLRDALETLLAESPPLFVSEAAASLLEELAKAE
jgi:HEAT repeat protein